MTESHEAWTKQTLRTRMDQGLTQFLALIDSFSPDQMLIPTDPAGWNVRDHVTHLAVWVDGVAVLLRREDRWAAMGLTLNIPTDVEIDYDEEPDYDTLNARIVAHHRHVSPADARAWLIAAHNCVVDGMEVLTETEFSAPYERFVAPYTSDRGYPIDGYIVGGTADHYDEHTPWVLAIVQSGPT